MSLAGTLARPLAGLPRRRRLLMAAFVLADVALIGARGGLGRSSVAGKGTCTDDLGSGSVAELLRLGRRRLQYCPVGRHWSLVTRVARSELDEDERRLAAARRDLPLP